MGDFREQNQFCSTYMKRHMPCMKEIADYSTHQRASIMPCGFKKTTVIPVWAGRFMIGDGEHSIFNVLVTEKAYRG